MIASAWCRALVLVAGLLALPALAQTQVHTRGEFKFAVGPAPDFVVERTVAPQWPQDAGAGASDPWRNWLIDRQVDRRGGRYVAFDDRAFQPLSETLVGEAARFSIDFSPLYQTLTIHRVELRRDGAWLNRLDPAQISLARRESGFEENLSDGDVTALIVLEDVRAGDVVRVSYTVDGSNPILEGHITSYFLMAWTNPMLERSGRVLFDPGTAVAVKNLGIELPVQRTDHPDRREVSMLSRNVAGIRDAGRYPNWYTPFPYIEIAPEWRWSDIVDWALPLYPADVTLPPELEARLAEWKAIADPFQRAAAVLRATQEEVRYFGVEMGDNTHQPNPPAVTWARRYGDCKDKTYLAVVLLRRLGLEAEPALVSTREGRAVANQLPAASAFNHVIVRLRLQGKSYWLDPTLSQQRGDIRQLDLFDYGVALPVVAGSDKLVTVLAPDQVDSGLVVKETFVPSGDGKSIDLKVEATYRGGRAEAIRHRMLARPFEQLATDFADYYRKQYGELTVVTPATASEDPKTNVTVIREHYRLDEALKRNGDGSYIDLFAESLAADLNLPSSMARTEPLALSRPGELRHEVAFELPEGWVLSTLPGRLDAKGGPLDFHRTLAQDKRTVNLVHRMRNDSDHVGTDAMPDYLTALRTAKESLNMRLHFGLPTAVKNSDRDRRLRELLRGSLQ